MAKIKPFRVNLVEEAGWKNWDFANSDGVSQWASDNAWDDWKNMDESTCYGYVEDLVGAALRKSEQRKVTKEDIGRICEQLKEDPNQLEAVKQAIMDTHTWAWEVAYMPNDQDIKRAIDRTAKVWEWDFSMGNFWELVLVDEVSDDPREWSPRGIWTTHKLYNDFVGRISYERKPGYYDRFLVFDLGESPAVQRLLGLLKENPEQGSAEELEEELNNWKEDYLKTFFSELEKWMQSVDPSFRWDLDPHWKSILKDKAHMGDVRREILEFLATPRKEEVE